MITLPQVSLLCLFATLEYFVSYSGLTVNQSKSMVMDNSLSTTNLINLQCSFTFSWTTQLSYLGIFLTLTYNNLHKANYPPLICALVPLLRTCTQYQISWLGTLNAIKMRFLPKLLYYFQVLPISLPKIVSFTIRSWSLYGTQPSLRSKKHTLYWNKLSGGLVVPHLLHYYRATKLVPHTCLYANSEVPLSMPLEAIDCTAIS